MDATWAGGSVTFECVGNGGVKPASWLSSFKEGQPGKIKGPDYLEPGVETTGVTVEQCKASCVAAEACSGYSFSATGGGGTCLLGTEMKLADTDQGTDFTFYEKRPAAECQIGVESESITITVATVVPDAVASGVQCYNSQCGCPGSAVYVSTPWCSTSDGEGGIGTEAYSVCQSTSSECTACDGVWCPSIIVPSLLIDAREAHISRDFPLTGADNAINIPYTTYTTDMPLPTMYVHSALYALRALYPLCACRPNLTCLHVRTGLTTSKHPIVYLRTHLHAFASVLYFVLFVKLVLFPFALVGLLAP